MIFMAMPFVSYFVFSNPQSAIRNRPAALSEKSSAAADPVADAAAAREVVAQDPAVGVFPFHAGDALGEGVGDDHAVFGVLLA